MKALNYTKQVILSLKFLKLFSQLLKKQEKYE